MVSNKMNLSKKHLHKSQTFLKLMSSKLESTGGVEDYDDDYLLGLVDYDFSNQVNEEALNQETGALVLDIEDDVSIKYREFPLEDGYVRVPTLYPGLTISAMEAPDLKLWTAETAFKAQVRYQLPSSRLSLTALNL